MSVCVWGYVCAHKFCWEEMAAITFTNHTRRWPPFQPNPRKPPVAFIDAEGNTNHALKQKKQNLIKEKPESLPGSSAIARTDMHVCNDTKRPQLKAGSSHPKLKLIALKTWNKNTRATPWGCLAITSTHCVFYKLDTRLTIWWNGDFFFFLVATCGTAATNTQ